MIMEKIKTDKVIIVEGKYDKIKLSNVVDATILTTDGFSLFNNREKCALIRRLAKKCGIVILTDSDSAGFVIRNKLKGFIDNDSEIINLYAPQIVGKEARKNKASKDGILGIEGIENETIRSLFERRASPQVKEKMSKITPKQTFMPSVFRVAMTVVQSEIESVLKTSFRWA